jgi:hypothetical protein
MHYLSGIYIMSNFILYLLLLHWAVIILRVDIVFGEVQHFGGYYFERNESKYDLEIKFCRLDQSAPLHLFSIGFNYTNL